VTGVHAKSAPTQRTGRWGFCAVFEYFSGFEFFLLSNIVHARLIVEPVETHMSTTQIVGFSVLSLIFDLC